MNRLVAFMLTVNLLLIGFIFGLAASNHAHPPLEGTQSNAASNVATQKGSDTQLQEAVFNSLTSFFSEKSPEKASPADRISQGSIHVLNDKVIIDIENPEWAKFTDTNSMDPVFDNEANAIEIVPKTPNEIQVGDIISYQAENQEFNIIHRVVEKGEDEEGDYFIVKGDNNNSRDPGKIRFGQIKRVVVAIIY